MEVLRVFFVMLLLALVGCAGAPVMPQMDYASVSKTHLGQLRSWVLDGRLSVTSPDDSWSANVVWRREGNADKIELSGPLGQGAVVIRLLENEVSVDRGDGHIQHSSDPDQFVLTQLGVFVPVRALAYWVVGLPEPQMGVHELAQGFDQGDWKVEYKEWSDVKGKAMPRKLTVTNTKVKLKLVCDQWVINE